jgi:chaperonin GroES
MTIKPLGDHVVVQLIEKEEMTASGIVLPDTVEKEKKAEGKVVAVGPGKMLDSGVRAPIDVQVGDHILFEKWGGEDVEIDDTEYKVVSADKILAVLEG